MSGELVDRLARALLYEGYILYPYRPSVKNHQRWTFGGVYPQSWSDAQKGTDAAAMQTQCLIAGGAGAKVRIRVRFLHLMQRTVGKPAAGQATYEPVESLRVGERHYQTWQEAVEREVDLGMIGSAALPREWGFSFGERDEIETLRGEKGEVVGVLARRQEAVQGVVEVSWESVAPGLGRLSVRISNRTALEKAASASRDAALMRTLISTHTILEAVDGEFVSLLEPDDTQTAHAAACKNVGTWPVLVGTPPCRDTMLSSPIILYDYPQIAPESPGDLFDSTEIDEILTLRILTLTEEEQRAAAGTDERVRELLARTHDLGPSQLAELHGSMRGLRSVTQEQSDA